ncbi:MAG: hypothetical protein WBD22_14940 [Pyrinomonadaceae bacterium]
MKQFLVLQLIIVVATFQLNSCGYPETPMIRLRGPNDRMELVFFYKKDTGYDEREFFEHNILHIPDADGKGYDLQEGVSGEFSVRNADYEGHAIEFYPNARPEQREKLKQAIKESPIVYRVYENVVPNEIKDLPRAENVEANTIAR